MIRHNKLYSKLASDFIANSETLIAKLEDMPNHENVKNITMETQQINSRFTLIGDQFSNYKKEIEKYKDFIDGVLKNRVEVRGEGNKDNRANKEQNDLL